MTALSGRFEEHWLCPACHATCTAGEPCASCGSQPVRAASRLETCRIERWRGYRTSTFYAVTDTGVVLCESRSFRWRRRETPPDRTDAREAFDELVSTLEADGWTRGAPVQTWFDLRFSRATGELMLLPDAAPPRPPEEPVVVFRMPRPPDPAPRPDPPVQFAPATPSAPEPPLRQMTTPAAAPRRRRRFWVFGSMGVVVIAVAAAAVMSRPATDEHAATAAPAREPVATQAAEHLRGRTLEAPASATAATTATIATTARAATPPARVRVVFAAHGNGSWLEVRNASHAGKLLYSGVLHDGDVRAFRSKGIWVRYGA